LNAVDYLRMDLSWAHELLELVMQDVTQDQLNWHPQGTANPIGATYAHAVCSEDAVIQGLLRGVPWMMNSSWEGKTGISELQFHSDFDWARRVVVDLPAAREYAQAVYKASDDCLASLSDADLDRQLDLTDLDFGMRSVGWVLSSLAISHLNNMTGEISALKGVQGAKGYPW